MAAATASCKGMLSRPGLASLVERVYVVDSRDIVISEHTWVNWTDEIRRRCGAELIRRGMFPPRKYFTMSS